MLPTLHRLADLAMVSAVPGARLYADGFGDREALEEMVDHIRSRAISEPVATIDVRWDGPEQRRGAVLSRRGRFDSPLAARMPSESQEAVFELIEPRGPTSAGPRGARPPVCLLLAATGEEGFFLRRRFALGLAESGYGSLLLENPFYGARRPRGQLGPVLRTVEAQFAMNLATVAEARALLRWLVDRGHPGIGVSGYSQGGIMAAFAASLSDFPVAVVPRGAGSAAGPIFTNAALSRRIHWPRLASEMRGVDAARAYFLDCLEPVQVARFPPPLHPEAAVIINARGDGFVPPAEARALHAHWPGSQLRWIRSSHVIASVLHGRPQRRAILDAFAEIERVAQ
jgi:hypothetical protein